MTTSKAKRVLQILKESPLFSTLTSSDYNSILKQIDRYPSAVESIDESDAVGYEASWLFMSSVYKNSPANR
jgi:hypothetical protein